MSAGPEGRVARLPRADCAGRGATPRRRDPGTGFAAASAVAGPAGAETDAVRVLRQFRIVFNAVKSHLQRVERATGTSGAQIWALHVIRERPGLGVSELAQSMNVRQPTASVFVRSLLDRSLIEVRRDRADRRVARLHILPAGRRLLRRAPGPFAGVLPGALAALDARSLRELEAGLAQLIERLGASERAGTMPIGGAG